MENEKLAGAIRTINNCCSGRIIKNNICYLEDGSICPMNHNGTCFLQKMCKYGTPDVWNIPVHRRFTDADIALASALKAFGVYEIYKKSDNSIFCIARINGEENMGLPNGAFKGIAGGETVSIDDIIGKENCK